MSVIGSLLRFCFLRINQTTATKSTHRIQTSANAENIEKALTSNFEKNEKLSIRVNSISY